MSPLMGGLNNVAIRLSLGLSQAPISVTVSFWEYAYYRTLIGNRMLKVETDRAYSFAVFGTIHFMTNLYKQ